MRGLGVARVALAGAAGAALVLGATHDTGRVDLRSAPAAAPASAEPAPSTPVSQRGLLCPGPERLGIKGALEARQRVTAVAAAAPTEVLPREARDTSPGSLRLQRLSASGATDAHAGGPDKDRVSTNLDSADGALFLAGGSFAPGAAAMQYFLARSGNQRGLATVACGQPSAHAWLLGGGAEAGRLERVVLLNPAANAVTVDLQVLGRHGAVDSETGRGVVVPPRGRTAILLDSIAGAETTPAVQVTARGGEVYAALSDTWLDGVVPRGGDTTVSTAQPAKEQVVTGVPVDGPVRLRVAVPGDAQAVVQTRVLTTKGPRGVKHDVVRVDAHSSRDIDLSGLPAGTYAVQVHADVPVVAAATVDRGRKAPASRKRLDRTATDLAWTPSSSAVDQLAGTPLPPTGKDGTDNTLTLANTGTRTSVSVTTVDAKGKVATKTVDVPPDSVRTVPLESAASMWVRTHAETVHAAVVTTARAKDGGVLVAALPLSSAPMVTTPASIRPAVP